MHRYYLSLTSSRCVQVYMVFCLNLCIPHSNARGATPRQRPGAVDERSYPTSKEWWPCGCRRAERSYSTFKVRKGSLEEIPLVQGKRNPSKMVGVTRGHQRADRLKPQSQKTSQSDHRTTALSNSVKLSHAV